MPSSQFIRSIAANIAYWQQRTQNLTGETLSAIEQDRQNLYRAIEFGAQLKETWRETAVIQSIYDISGGNPLALKLVVSLADVLPLPQILADLTHNRVGPIEDLYRHIYWQAWHTLTPHAQALLQAMPLVAASGALPEQMKMMAGLEDDAFWTAVHELSTRSLLEIQGTIHQRRYNIHRLTETFLRTEIIHWPEG